MNNLSRAGLGFGIAVAFALIGAEARAAVTTYALPGQAGIYKNPSSDLVNWANGYGRMTHLVLNPLASTSANTSELDFPLTAIAGATSISGLVNVDVSNPLIVGVKVPTACTQMLALDASGTSVLATPLQCQSGGGVVGFTLATGSLTPFAQFYSFIAVWASYAVTVNSVSYAITK